jgi:RNA polymerase sigma-70 factor (ECF subfamily)
VVGYLKTTARFLFADRLRRHLRCHEDDHLPWEDTIAERMGEGTDETPSEEGPTDLLRALEKLDAPKRAALMAVYGEGMTYDEAARATGLPLGTLKGHLRSGTAFLRRALRKPPARGSRKK